MRELAPLGSFFELIANYLVNVRNPLLVDSIYDELSIQLAKVWEGQNHLIEQLAIEEEIKAIIAENLHEPDIIERELNSRIELFPSEMLPSFLAALYKSRGLINDAWDKLSDLLEDDLSQDKDLPKALPETAILSIRKAAQTRKKSIKSIEAKLSECEHKMHDANYQLTRDYEIDADKTLQHFLLHHASPSCEFFGLGGDNYVFNFAAENGWLGLIKIWWPEQRDLETKLRWMRNSSKFFIKAVRRGDLEILEWFRQVAPDMFSQNLSKDGHSVFIVSISCRQLAVLKWLTAVAENDFSMMFVMLYGQASMEGCIKVLRWLQESNPEAFTNAFMSNNEREQIVKRIVIGAKKLDVLKFFFELLAPEHFLQVIRYQDYYLFSKLTEHSCLEGLKWLREIFPQEFTAALEVNYICWTSIDVSCIEILEWLREIEPKDFGEFCASLIRADFPEFISTDFWKDFRILQWLFQILPRQEFFQLLISWEYEPLLWAAGRGDLRAIQWFKEISSVQEFGKMLDAGNYAIFRRAAKGGCLLVLEYLYQERAEVLEVDNAVLHKALSSSQVRTLEWLEKRKRGNVTIENISEKLLTKAFSWSRKKKNFIEFLHWSERHFSGKTLYKNITSKNCIFSSTNGWDSFFTGCLSWDSFPKYLQAIEWAEKFSEKGATLEKMPETVKVGIIRNLLNYREFGNLLLFKGLFVKYDLEGLFRLSYFNAFSTLPEYTRARILIRCWDLETPQEQKEFHNNYRNFGLELPEVAIMSPPPPLAVNAHNLWLPTRPSPVETLEPQALKAPRRDQEPNDVEDAETRGPAKSFKSAAE